MTVGIAMPVSSTGVSSSIEDSDIRGGTSKLMGMSSLLDLISMVAYLYNKWCIPHTLYYYFVALKQLALAF